MLEHLLHWIRYNADGPLWCYLLMAGGLSVLLVVIVALIREQWF